jgi:pyruvate/2-oxoglutarate dehydrogenase complex dihydrolipoamide acyltransferase (E2) component
VLTEYGDNIDAAIKHLTELRLTVAGSAAAGHAAAAAAEQQQVEEQPPQQPAQQEPQQHHTGPPATASATDVNGKGPRSAEEWVEVVVREMSAASDLADASSRASRVLRAFEQAAVSHAQSAGGSDSAEVPRLRSQLAEAQRENQLLKRAVAIQNARMQELRWGLGGGHPCVAGMPQCNEPLHLSVASVLSFGLATGGWHGCCPTF